MPPLDDTYSRSDDDTSDTAIPPPTPPGTLPPPPPTPNEVPTTLAIGGAMPGEVARTPPPVEPAAAPPPAIGGAKTPELPARTIIPDEPPPAPSPEQQALEASPPTSPTLMSIKGAPGPHDGAIGADGPLVDHTPRLHSPAQQYKDLEQNNPQLFSQINTIADSTGVPRRDLAAVVYASSNGDPNYRKAGRVGYGGITPDDYERLDPDKAMDPNDPIDNLYMTAEKLKRVQDLFGRGTPESMAAYWAGGDRVEALLRRHPDDHKLAAPEGTFQFVNKVFGRGQTEDHGDDTPGWITATSQVGEGAKQTGELATGAQAVHAPPTETADQRNARVLGAIGNTLSSGASHLGQIVQNPELLGQLLRAGAHNVVQAAPIPPDALSPESAPDSGELGGGGAPMAAIGDYLKRVYKGAASGTAPGTPLPEENIVPPTQMPPPGLRPEPAGPPQPGTPTGTMVAGSALPIPAQPAAPAPVATPAPAIGLVTPAQAATHDVPPVAPAPPVPPVAQVPLANPAAGGHLAPGAPAIAAPAPTTTGSGQPNQPGGAGSTPPVAAPAATPPAATPPAAAPAAPSSSGAAAPTPAVGANAPAAPANPPITSLSATPATITMPGVVAAAARGGPEAVATYMINNARAGATVGDGWNHLRATMVAAALAKGDIAAAAHANEFVFQLQHQGAYENLAKGFHAFQNGDMQSAATFLARSHMFVPDGTMAGFQLTPDGKGLVMQRFDEDSHQPLGKPMPVTLAGIRSLLIQTNNPKDFYNMVNEDRKTTETERHNTVGEAEQSRGHDIEEKRIASTQETARLRLEREQLWHEEQLQKQQQIHADQQRSQTIADVTARRTQATKEAADFYGDTATNPATDLVGNKLDARGMEQAQNAYISLKTHNPDIAPLAAREIVKNLTAPEGSKDAKFLSVIRKNDKTGETGVYITDLQGNNVAYIPAASARSLFPSAGGGVQKTPAEKRAAAGGGR